MTGIKWLVLELEEVNKCLSTQLPCRYISGEVHVKLQCPIHDGEGPELHCTYIVEVSSQGENGLKV